MRNWEETYDGILVDNDVISVHQSTWITGFVPGFTSPTSSTGGGC